MEVTVYLLEPVDNLRQKVKVHESHGRRLWGR